MPPLDADRCYAAASSRDARFDGTFIVAVRTTGIYCRPSCPAITPKRSNVEFHHTAAAAQQRGFRACKRCLPDATPGSPEWNMRHDVVARAMRLIADGVVERDGVRGLAARLGYSERHLNRLLSDEVGAGPLALARAQRAHTARTLIETTDLTLTDVAFASGFGSVRQFNDTIREVYAAAPSTLRSTARTRRQPAPSLAPTNSAMTSVSIRLPTRAPFDGAALLDFLAMRAIPGVESVDGDGVYRRVVSLDGGPCIVALQPVDDDRPYVLAQLRLTDVADLATAVQRIRRLLDLDADPTAIDEHLRAGSLRALVDASPGRRAPGALDPFEMLVRAIVGQQISVAGARTVTARLVAAIGTGLDEPADATEHGLERSFPTAEAFAEAPDEAFSMPTARRDTIRRAAQAVADGLVRLDPGADPDTARAELLALKGIGPWTADYVIMRGLGHPDIWLGTDLVVRHTLEALGVAATDADEWAPWRSYALQHLWASHGSASSRSPRSNTATRTPAT